MRVMRGSDECWALGDTALEREPVIGSGPRGGTMDRLAAIAAELGVEEKTMRIYRGVANAWPKSKRRKKMPFGVHAALRSESDRFDLIKQRDWTTAEAREFVRQRRKSV